MAYVAFELELGQAGVDVSIVTLNYEMSSVAY